MKKLVRLWRKEDFTSMAPIKLSAPRVWKSYLTLPILNWFLIQFKSSHIYRLQFGSSTPPSWTRVNKKPGNVAASFQPEKKNWLKRHGNLPFSEGLQTNFRLRDEDIIILETLWVKNKEIDWLTCFKIPQLFSYRTGRLHATKSYHVSLPLWRYIPFKFLNYSSV